MPQVTQPPLVLSCAWDSPGMVGFTGAGRGSWDTSKLVFALLGTVPRQGQTRLPERSGKFLSLCGHSLQPEHISCRLAGLGMPRSVCQHRFARAMAWLGRGTQAAWATSSAESQCSWETILQPAPSSESQLGVQRGAVIIEATIST